MWKGRGTLGGLFSAPRAAHLPDTHPAVPRSMVPMLLHPTKPPKTASGTEGHAPDAMGQGAQHQDQNPRGRLPPGCHSLRSQRGWGQAWKSMVSPGFEGLGSCPRPIPFIKVEKPMLKRIAAHRVLSSDRYSHDFYTPSRARHSAKDFT